jgi:probable rRNA maturation factor
VGEIAIVLADDARSRAINREWRGIDHATDVISFAYDEHEHGAAALPVRGDLLISMQRVHVQAERYRASAGAELARLVIHGALHLSGHDHMKTGERRVMRQAEEAALARARVQVRALDAVFKSASKATARKPRKPARSLPRPRALHRATRNG